jgi:TRAP-type C4-dicarboxylate transport system permease small subunit
MKVFAWLLCVATVAGICIWGSQAQFLRDYFQSAALFLAVLIPAAILAGLLVVSLLMIFLNLARDVRLIRIRLCQKEDER